MSVAEMLTRPVNLPRPGRWRQAPPYRRPRPFHLDVGQARSVPGLRQEQRLAAYSFEEGNAQMAFGRDDLPRQGRLRQSKAHRAAAEKKGGGGKAGGGAGGGRVESADAFQFPAISCNPRNIIVGEFRLNSFFSAYASRSLLKGTSTMNMQSVGPLLGPRLRENMPDPRSRNPGPATERTSRCARRNCCRPNASVAWRTRLRARARGRCGWRCQCDVDLATDISPGMESRIARPEKLPQDETRSCPSAFRRRHGGYAGPPEDEGSSLGAGLQLTCISCADLPGTLARHPLSPLLEAQGPVHLEGCLSSGT